MFLHLKQIYTAVFPPEGNCSSTMAFWCLFFLFYNNIYVVASSFKRCLCLQPVADVFKFWFQVGIFEASACFHQALLVTIKKMYSCDAFRVIE